MAEGGVSSDYDKDAPESVIISGVIDGVKQSFIDSGVDLDVLSKLQDLWISKLKSNSSPGLSIADVMQMDPPAPARKSKGKGKGKGKNRVPVVKKSPDIDDDVPEDVGEKEKNSASVESSDIIVISSDEHEELPVKLTKSKLKSKIPQLDGPADSSDEDGVDDDDDDDGDDDDDDDDDDNDPDGEDDEGVEEEPLGSEDDISDEDASDLFDTENVVVCQYDKITRARNKWKFHLKDGIMNLDGKDYVFQRATGEAEW